jgi:hypothetical protein
MWPYSLSIGRSEVLDVAEHHLDHTFVQCGAKSASVATDAAGRPRSVPDEIPAPLEARYDRSECPSVEMIL